MEGEPGFWREDWSDDTLARGIEAARGLAFVWEEEENILGFACGHDLGFRGYLSELIVGRSARGRGIGRALVERIQEGLASRGCPTLIADVWRDAASFYGKLGWGPPDAVLLRKRLGGAA